MGCLLDDLRAFGINANQWTTAAYSRTRESCARWRRRFMAKWSAAQKIRAGLRHAVVCPNARGGTKERIVQSKCDRAGKFDIFD